MCHIRTRWFFPRARKKQEAVGTPQAWSRHRAGLSSGRGHSRPSSLGRTCLVKPPTTRTHGRIESWRCGRPEITTMSTSSYGYRHLQCLRELARPQLGAARWKTAGLHAGRRTLTTDNINRNETRPDSAESGRPTRSQDASLGVVPIFKFQSVSHARAIPASPSYFSRQPNFNDAFVRVTGLLNKYRALPIVPSDQAPRVMWKPVEEYRQTSGEPVKARQYGQVLRIVKRLNLIEPELVPVEVTEGVDEFKRDIVVADNGTREIPIDRFGRAIGVGKRKASTARAWVVEGTGEVQINGKSLSEAFGRVHDRESAVWALRATERIDKYNVWALVEGGGTTGQAEALTLAVAKALVAHEPALKPALRRGTWKKTLVGTSSPALILSPLRQLAASPATPEPSRGRSPAT